MAKSSSKSPTHYTLKVSAPREVKNIRFRVGVKYTVTAAIYEEIKDIAVDPQPVQKG